MIESIVRFFSKRHLLTNLVFISVLVGGYFAWQNTKKEELPDITFDMIRISVVYPGATAGEIEHFVTREIEKALKGVEGIYRVTSNSNQGSVSLTVELEKDYPDKNEAIAEIKNVVLDVDLPDEIRDDPTFRVFKTSRKAIMDVALFNHKVHLHDSASRKELQTLALTLENYLLRLPEVNSVEKSGYLQSELQINVDPARLTEFRIPLSQVIREIRDGHVRMPAGNIEAKNEPKVTISAGLDSVDKLNALIVQAGFEGQAIKLGELAHVREDFHTEKEIIKVNGHEAVMLNVIKNTSFGILDSTDAVSEAVRQFSTYQLKDTPYEIVILDDESADTRNRLSIITSNGLLGFVLILGILFVFLNVKSGFWVAMGIPFSLAFTVICGNLLGYTINNTTLAAVIIVMGIVVDDAIIIAENISRRRAEGLSSEDATITGTAEIFWPILASILTTCIAFIPLFFFSGRFGELNKFIPPVIFLMLGASLIESLIILPGHMHFNIPVGRRTQKLGAEKTAKNRFAMLEKIYSIILKHVLTFRYVVLGLFAVMILFGTDLARKKMKFVMFPDEETREITISASAPPLADRIETALIAKNIENALVPYLGKEVVGFRTEIARSRRGGAVEENKFRMIIEIVPKEKRQKSADELIALWEPEVKSLNTLQKISIQKNRFGQGSGSAIEILVQENHDETRSIVAQNIVDWLKQQTYIKNAEIEQPITIPEYKIDLDREKIKRLSMNPVDIANTFRASLEGIVVYEIPYGDEEMDVKISVIDDAKKDIENILDIPVENNRDYLVPLRDIVTVEKTATPQNISRQDEKRTTIVYADLIDASPVTPLEAADQIEEAVFREMNQKFPSTVLSFAGEIRDSRESKEDLINAAIVVTVLIFNILAILLNSLLQPFIIMLAIPFGILGVIFAFVLHGKLFFGFFAAIGVLGLSGVVINDTIVLLDKLNYAFKDRLKPTKENIAAVTATRLRAIILTTLTTIVGLVPTAYGIYGFDNMLSDMMLAMIWGLSFGTIITLILIPCLYRILVDLKHIGRKHAE